MEDRIRDYYQLKGTLDEVQLGPSPTRLVLVFDKRSDPMYSFRRLDALRGFVICSVKRPSGESKQAYDNDSETAEQTMQSVLPTIGSLVKEVPKKYGKS